MPAEDRIGELETLRFPIPAALIYYHRRDCPRIADITHEGSAWRSFHGRLSVILTRLYRLSP